MATVKVIFVHGADNVKIIDVDLPDLAAAQAEAEKLFGRPYGYDACIDGGMHDMFGVQLPGNGELTADCSETVTRILRAGGRPGLPDQTAVSVTPWRSCGRWKEVHYVGKRSALTDYQNNKKVAKHASFEMKPNLQIS